MDDQTALQLEKERTELPEKQKLSAGRKVKVLFCCDGEGFSKENPLLLV